jgi:hypothetical protein
MLTLGGRPRQRVRQLAVASLRILVADQLEAWEA